MCCRVGGFRVRIWESYRTSRSFGYGHGSVTELTEVLGIVARAYRTRRTSGRVQNMLYTYPGFCGTGITELTEISGSGMKVLKNFQKFLVLWHGRTELAKVPGRYENAVPVPRVFIKIQIHSSCEIENFVESHLCKLCVILRSRVLRVVCTH